jgi:two-component system nitrate/nitrite response regulator NarL
LRQNIVFTIVEDNRLLVDCLRLWADLQPDVALTASASAVDELLAAPGERADVVLLGAALRAEPDPAANVRRLLDAGYRVLVINGSPEPARVARTLAAGADGYLTRDHDLARLGGIIRSIAAGATTRSEGPVVDADPRLRRPLLSDREHAVLMAYASGRTLDSTARYLGISAETAKTYLKRVKAKYRSVGLPVYTKLDLAHQVREDCAAGMCRRQTDADAAH